jgi:hypothetical protein
MPESGTAVCGSVIMAIGRAADDAFPLLSSLS